MQHHFGEVANELADLAREGDSLQTRLRVIELLGRLMRFDGASFHNVSPQALDDPRTATTGNGRMLLSRVMETWASQVSVLSGPPIELMAKAGTIRVDDEPWGEGTLRDSPAWRDTFESVGVSDLLHALVTIPQAEPRFLILIRCGGERFTEAERDALALLLPFLALIGREGESPVRLLPITDAQRRIVELVRRGLTNEEIAEVLELSPNTVRNQLSDVFRRCNISNRTELVALLDAPVR